MQHFRHCSWVGQGKVLVLSHFSAELRSGYMPNLHYTFMSQRVKHIKGSGEIETFEGLARARIWRDPLWSNTEWDGRSLAAGA